MKISRFKEIVREVLVEENEYQIFFQKALEKAGKSIAQMGTQEKRDFFNKIDSAWKARGEKKNKKLVGKQTKLDVDKDGDIDASDLEKLRDDKLGEAVSTKVDAKSIASKMRKSSTMKGFADKVQKMGKVSHSDLEKLLPDYVAGKDIAGLFESNSIDEGGTFSNQTGIKSSITRNNQFRRAVGNLKIINWAMSDPVKIFNWKGYGLIFTDGHYEMIIDPKKPMRVLVPLQQIRNQFKSLYNNESKNSKWEF